MTGRHQREDTTEAGFGMVELVVVMGLLAIVTVVVLSSMLATTTASARTEERALSLQSAREGLERFVQDVRAANPIEAASGAVSLYDTEVAFSIYCSAAGVGSCGSDHLRRVEYRVVDNRLEREEGGVTRVLIGPAGPIALPSSQQLGAVVNGSRPAFEYFDRTGLKIATSGAAAPASSTFRNCTKEVRVTLVVVSQGGSSPATIDLTTSATLRNFHEVDGC